LNKGLGSKKKVAPPSLSLKVIHDLFSSHSGFPPGWSANKIVGEVTVTRLSSESLEVNRNSSQSSRALIYSDDALFNLQRTQKQVIIVSHGTSVRVAPALSRLHPGAVLAIEPKPFHLAAFF
jgi:hypothetical protein